jgi:hypothetical protein
MHAFEGLSLDNFVERGLLHLREYLPNQTKACSDDQLRQRIRSCVERARPYGLTSERQVMVFTDSTFLLGEYFDTDQRRRWPSVLLNNRNLAGDSKATWLISFGQLTSGGKV